MVQFISSPWHGSMCRCLGDGTDREAEPSVPTMGRNHTWLVVSLLNWERLLPLLPSLLYRYPDNLERPVVGLVALVVQAAVAAVVVAAVAAAVVAVGGDGVAGIGDTIEMDVA